MQTLSFVSRCFYAIGGVIENASDNKNLDNLHDHKSKWCRGSMPPRLSSFVHVETQDGEAGRAVRDVQYGTCSN